MTASATDKLKKYKSLFSTTLSTGIGTGTGDTITPASVSGLPTDTAITLTFDRVDSGGVDTPTKLERIVGVISGGNFTSYVRGVDGTTEQAHTAGAVIEMIWNADDWNDAVDWALTQHNQDGTHGAITSTNASMVTASMVTPTINAGKFITSINDANGNEVFEIPVTTNAVNQLKPIPSATGNAVQLAVSGGDTNISLNLIPKGSGVITKPTSVVMQLVAGETQLAIGDGVGYFTVPEELNGMNLVSVHARVVTAGTTNTTDIQIANVTDSVDMLSTKITIDSGETGSDTAATPAVIDTTKDDVVTNDLLRIDIDALSTTKPKGLIMRLKFALP